MIAVAETRPEIDLPGQTPARSFVAPLQQRLPGGFHQVGRFVPRNVGAGVNAPEVRYMPVRVSRVVDILQPLLQLSVLANLIGRNLAIHRFQRIAKSRVGTQNFTGRYAVFEQIADDLVVHRWASN